jgi:hypothetical protein
MPSLAVLISEFEARRAARIAQEAASSVLTPLGHATVAMYRLKHRLAVLGEAERRALLGLAAAELGMLPGTSSADRSAGASDR